MISKKRAAGVLWLALAPSIATAAIHFDSKVVDVRAPTGAEKVEAKFTFRNTGSKRERIHRIETNCGCLSAKADRFNLGPGEAGTLTAVFNVKGKSGRFGKTLSVTTGGADQVFPFGFGAKSRGEVTQLEVRVSIPELVNLEPESVLWRVGEKPAAKTVRVAMNHDRPIRILKLESSRPTVTAELITVQEGKTYEIRITPQSTVAPLLGVVRLDTDCPVAEQRRQMAFFRIEK